MWAKAFICIGVCFVPIIFSSPFAQGQTCTQAEAIAAEESVLLLTSWDKIYEHFKSYKHCDDGAIAEGYDDRVVHILASQWNQLPYLAKIMATDNVFNNFILQHIGITADADELKKVAEYSKKQCPAGYNELCSQIGVAIEKIE